MSTTTQHLPRRHRLTVTDYYRMAEVGILRPDARVELIEGEIIDMPPIGSRHAGTVEQMAQVLRRAVKDEAMVRTQQPVALDAHSEPEPDITLVLPRDDHYKTAHPGPSDVLLIIEVSTGYRKFGSSISKADSFCAIATRAKARTRVRTALTPVR